MKLWQRWKQTAVHNKALVATSILVAFGTLFYATAAGFQVWLMNESSMHTDEQIGRVIGNVNWMARAMDETAEQSANSVKATQEQMRLDERAWIGVESVTGAARVGEYLSIAIQIKNSGKTPAKNVVAFLRAEPVLKGKSPTFTYANIPHTSAIMAPNAGRRIPSIQPLTAMDETTLNAIKSGDIVEYLYGTVNYSDVFGSPHWLKFCYSLDRDAAHWDDCDTYNDTGDYQGKSTQH